MTADKWQPIETAPRDGTPILVTDGKTFAVATAWDYVEPDTLGYQETERPNPSAGRVHHYWHTNGLTSWEPGTIGVDYDHRITYGDDEDYRLFDRVTHWMPLPEPPKI